MRTGMIWGILAIAGILCLSGCRARVQYVPVESESETIDSVVIRDSVVERTFINRKDSTYIKDSTVIVLDDKGNVIRTELYRERDRFRELNSDYRLLQARCDSLLNVKQVTTQVPYPVERELSRWERTKIEVGGWAIGLLSGCLIIGIGYLVRWLIRRKK